MLNFTDNRLPRQRRYFGVALLLATVFVAGFSRNFYLRYWLGSHPLTALAYLHGAVMSSWVAVFVVQALLISTRRTPLHRRLGAWGVWLAGVALLLGVITISAAIERNVPELTVQKFVVNFVGYDGLSLMFFAVLVAAAVLKRRNAAWHKRLLLMANVSLLPPAFGRLVALVDRRHVEITVLALMGVVLAICLCVDYRTTKRVHPGIWLASAGIAVIEVTTYFAQVAD